MLDGSCWCMIHGFNSSYSIWLRVNGKLSDSVSNADSIILNNESKREYHMLYHKNLYH
jgi:hypothetical protein